VTSNAGLAPANENPPDAIIERVVSRVSAFNCGRAR
jgi:hypothetical protein